MIRARFAAVLSIFLAGPLPVAAEPFGGSGAHFFVARGFEPEATTAEVPCTVPSPVRRSELRTFQPAQGSGEILPGTPYTPIGDLVVCYLAGAEGLYEATAEVTLRDGEATLVLRASGECRDVPTPIAPDTWLQTCSLTLLASPLDRVRGGLLTNNGLIPRGEPAASRNDHVWTIFVLRD